MNNLEFIDKEIEATESAIDAMLEMLDDKVYCYFNKESVLDRLNEGKKRLQTLQQIKTKLEAWEVFNNNVEIEEVEKINPEEVEKTNPFMQNTYKQYFIKGTALYKSEVIKIKKAKGLEVKE